jgi:hypothetical protein
VNPNIDSEGINVSEFVNNIYNRNPNSMIPNEVLLKRLNDLKEKREDEFLDEEDPEFSLNELNEEDREMNELNRAIQQTKAFNRQQNNE